MSTVGSETQHSLSYLGLEGTWNVEPGSNKTLNKRIWNSVCSESVGELTVYEENPGFGDALTKGTMPVNMTTPGDFLLSYYGSDFELALRIETDLFDFPLLETVILVVVSAVVTGGHFAISLLLAERQRGKDRRLMQSGIGLDEDYHEDDDW